MPLPRDIPEIEPQPSLWERVSDWFSQWRDSLKQRHEPEPQRHQKESQPEINLPDGAVGATAQSQGFIGFIPPNGYQMDTPTQSLPNSDNQKLSQVGDLLIPTDETLREGIKEFNEENYQTVVSFLEQGITSPSEISKQTGINRSSIYRYRERYLKSQD